MLQPHDTASQDPILTEPRLTPLDRLAGSLGQRVYLTLRHAILSLAYRPGEILRKPEICAELGVSRSPVSDAVARLAAEGLVDVIPQAGTYVARFSMEEIREGAFLREAIEVAAIELVARTITDEQLVILRRNLVVQAALLADNDFAGFYKLDGEMHELLLSFTGYRKLAAVSDTAWAHVNRARQLVLPVPGRVAATLAEHRAILSALEARDPDAARSAIRSHLRQLVTYLEPLERSHPDLFNP
ncbi:MAG: GntR family transcriptional regulator [Rhodobacterales bacterium RIFCSPHIGHO2_02_FULL_62_130]|nr:MAG: GntR family transcriptional regulator [Rhodobacterales bacterium RIFCSPHIGHO2_02_FULL_62_130]OHC56459.1 MAG: GntR family transcriptional regulator [Rhodobacterales bacterium RIFCSPHIGHO2_12_FULL_62_75]